MVGQLDSILSSLGEPEGEGWATAEKISPGLSELFRNVVRAYEMTDLEDPEVLPSNFMQAATSALSAVGTACAAVIAGPATPRFDQSVGTFRQALDRAWAVWRNELRPHLGRPSLDEGRIERTAMEHLGKATEALARAAEARDSYAELEARASKLLTEVGTGELASFYSAQASKHQATARTVLKWLAGIIVALAAGGFVLLLTLPDTSDFGALARELSTRLVVVGAVSYALVFTARLYRVNTHLQSVYEQKAKALETYMLFARGLEGDDSRTAILAELVRAVFSPAETGLIDSAGERTVIESASPMLAALMSRRA